MLRVIGDTAMLTTSNPYLVKIAEMLANDQEHQKRVLSRLDETKGLIAAHSMGSGKTLTALRAIEKTLKNKSGDILVTVPAPLVSNIKEESIKHKIDISDPRVSILSYEQAANRIDELKHKTHALVVADEAHRLRNKETKRASELGQVFKKSESNLLLTGTPAYNKPHDIAVLVNTAAGEKVLPDTQKDFEDRYVGQRKVEPGFFAKHFLGVTAGTVPYLKNTQELKDILKKHVDHHDAKHVNPEDFPTSEERTIKVEMDKKQQEVYHYLEGKVPVHIRWKIRMGLPLDKKESANLNAFSTGVRQASNAIHPFVEGLQHEDHTSPKHQKMLESFLDHKRSLPNFKGLVYSNYLDSGLRPYKKLLDKHGVKAEIFDGTLKPKQKDALKQAFNNGQLDALLVSSSGTEGLNLKGTKMVQVMEPHFNKSKIDQVVARASRYKSHEHLPDEERHVIVEKYHSTLAPSALDKVVGHKAKSIDEYLDNLSDEKHAIQQGIMNLVKAASLDNHYLERIYNEDLVQCVNDYLGYSYL